MCAAGKSKEGIRVDHGLQEMRERGGKFTDTVKLACESATYIQIISAQLNLSSTDNQKELTVGNKFRELL